MAPKRSAAPRARTAARALSRPPGVVRALAPSRHSLAVGLALLALAGGAYAAARETSAFAVRRVEVTGGTPEVRAQVQRDVASVVGTSLVGLDGARLVRHVEALPTVVSAVYDRDFPHTLRVSIVPETSVAVLHQGRQTWLVSARGRVVAHVPQRTFPLLPRIWVPAATPVTAGAFLGPAVGGTVARSLAVALAARFPARIATAAFQRDGLVFRLRSGLELRLGDPSDVRLKLAIARRALDQLPAGTVYLDVSVPGRPVTGINPKLSALG